MDESSDEDFSAIKLPPIIDQLKRLLEQYSDGQIIKELIQNAEDGGATEVKFLYTGRKHEGIKFSKKAWKETPIKIAMQAPAICVYNNGIFTDKDWEGIAAIQCSEKENEPLKVGRFGLGFKSVFHLTDCPLILSGDKVMVMNPLANVSKVVHSKKLCKIDRNSQTAMIDLIGDKFGFSEHCFKNGYQGTLFWFPLRKEPSDLSRDTYTYEKIQDIFRGFKDLAPSILLFLKKIEYIEVFEESENDLIYRVKISTKERDLQLIRQQRQDFLHKVEELNGKLANEYLFHYMKLSIICEGKKWLLEKQNDKDWIVVNHYHGGSVSDGLKRLIDDQEWSYSPYVSVAGCLSNFDDDFKGHIYCFLPLPLERTSPTGLPVHINGFFALSQDRHHIKWMSSEEDNRAGHSENSVEWNKILATEILPVVYSQMLKYLTEDDIDTNTIYKLLPKPELITENWKIFTKPLFKQLYQKNIIFTKASGGRWIKPDEAIVLVEEDYQDTILQAIEDIYILMQENVACLPDNFVQSLKPHGQIVVSDPSRLQDYLIQHDDIFDLMNINQKMNVLEYFISNDIDTLEDLKILPLANGEFQIFNAEEETVFWCEEESLKLFPGMESRFLLNNHSQDMLQKLIDRFQVKRLMPENIPELLQDCIKINSFRHKKITREITDWLDIVWKYIHKNNDAFQLSWISHLHLLPFKSELIQIDSVSILRSKENMGTLNPQLSNSLEKLGVKMITSLSNTISVLLEGEFVQYPTTEGIFNCLKKIRKNKQQIEKFNQEASPEERNQLLHTFANLSRDQVLKLSELIKQLEIFEVMNSNLYVCLNERYKMYYRGNHPEVPIHYEGTVIKCTSESIKNVGELCGCGFLEYDELIEVILSSLLIYNKSDKLPSYNKSDRIKFMEFFLKQLSHFEERIKIMKLAGDICFIENKSGELVKPRDLLDPSSTLLTDMFQPRDFPSKNREVKKLKKLGLRFEEDLTGKDILNLADTVIDDGTGSGEILKKRKALCQWIDKYQDRLDQRVIHLLTSKSICPIMDKRPESYPKGLPFKGEGTVFKFEKPGELFSCKDANLVGGVGVLSNKDIPQCFKSCIKPVKEEVFEQLKLVTTRFSPADKIKFLPVLNDIYQYINKNKLKIPGEIINQKIVWTGSNFQQSSNVYCTGKKDDLPLEPFRYLLPPEMRQYHCLFKKFGCMEEQNDQMLLEVLSDIKQMHDTNKALNKLDVSKDTSMVLQIINKLANSDQDYSGNILLPIHTDSSKLLLKPASECTVCNESRLKDLSSMHDDEDYGEDEEEIFYVHKEISSYTAHRFHVPTLKDRVLCDADKFDMNFGQNEPLTTRLKNLLKDYTDGFTVPKEIIQNADDAEASVVKFLYDERIMPKALTCLFDEGMEPVQGPAFWAYNDAKFTDADYENITKLAGATKKDDQMKIGRFGLGFNSVYNLTDTPSFISGDTYVIFDPHETHLHKSGLKIKLNYQKNRKMRQKMKGQFYPFDGIFQCKVLNEDQVNIDGTLFRFPLRNQSEAAKSLIKDFSYSKSEMKEFIQKIAEGCGNLLLFTQNVRKIELYHLPNGVKPNNAQLILEVTKSSNRDNISALKVLTSHESQDKLSQLSQEIKISVSFKKTETAQDYFKLPHLETQLNYLISWSFGKDKVVNAAKRKEFKGLLPIAGTAVLKNNQEDDTSNFGFYDRSHLFCFLPLPIPTSLPAHVNGSFAVQSSRRDLVWKNEDDIDVPEDEWNMCLLEDACCQAYLLMMTTVARDIPKEKYNKLWPNISACTSRHDKVLSRQIYKTICDGDYKVFQSNNEPVSINNAIFLDPTLREKDGLGDIAFKALCHFSKAQMDSLISQFGGISVVDLLPEVWKQFKSSGCEEAISQRIVTIEMFYSFLFFPTLTDKFWSPEEIDELLLYSLRLKNDRIKKLIETNDCIPTKPNHKRVKPNILIHPNGEIAGLFDESEERFPDDTNLKTGSFRNVGVLDILKNLGMMKDDLPWDQMPERITVAVQTQNEKLILTRFEKFITYMSTRRENNLKRFEFCPENIRQELAKLQFLPVKTLEWKFPQFSNSDKKIFVSAHEAYLQELQKFVGCTSPIVDISTRFYRYDDSVLKWLGVKHTEEQITLELVLENMLIMSQYHSQSPTNDLYHDLETSFKAMYKYFNDRIDNSEETLQQQERKELICKELKGKAVVLHQGSLTTPDVLVLEPGIYIEPYISSTNLGKTYEKLFTLIGVLPKLTAIKILEILIQIDNEKGDKVLDDAEIETIAQLCRLYVKLSEEERCMDGVSEKMKNIKLPDSENKLTSIESLCFDDSVEVYNKDIKNIKHLHKTFDRNTAEIFGVKSKRGHSFDAISSPLFVEFGQHEELTNRIRRILEGYPCDESILKEMLQNADDAGATEVIFIKDFRTLPKIHLPDKKLEEVQGPALCVFNNSFFTEEDLKGIQDLGTGSKKDEVLKTGQYGVGFNVVYHVTDVPSFWSKGGDVGETVCIFDPHCKYLSMANVKKPGVRIDAAGLRVSFPDFNEGFLPELTENLNQGTVFRLPLRNRHMAHLSEICKEEMTENHIDKIFDILKTKIFSSMLFLENITSVKFGTVKPDGKVQINYKVEACMDKQNQKQQEVFNKHLSDLNTRIKDKHGDAFHQVKEVTLSVKIEDSENQKEEYLIVKRAGFNNSLPDELINALKTGKLMKLPRGGVAMNLKKKVEGIAYCTLPLPISTGLPVHVNGQFALDHESRRNIWNDKISIAGLWNGELSSQIIAPAYLKLLEEFKLHPFSVRQNNLKKHTMKEDIKTFENIFPKSDLANGNFWKVFVIKIYTAIGAEKRPFFPVIKVNTQKWEDIEWVAVQTGEEFNGCFDTLHTYFKDETVASTVTTPYRSGFILQTHHVTKPNERKEVTLKQILIKLGMQVLETSGWVLHEFEQAKVKVQSVNPENVLKFLKSYQSEVENRCQLSIPDDIQNTPFGSLKNYKLVLKFVLREIKKETVTNLLGSPLLLKQNNTLDFYGEGKVIVTRFCDIFRDFSEQFIHLECVNLMKDYINNFDPLINWSLESFVKMLKHSYKYLTTCDIVQWNQTELPPNWIGKIWRFIADCLPNKELLVPGSPSFELLADMSIVPARKDQDEVLLYPLCKGKHVLHPCIETNNRLLKKMEEVFQIISLPFLFYVDGEMSFEVLQTIRCTVAELNNPQSMVELLKNNLMNLKCLDIQMAKTILEYFSSRIADVDSNGFKTLKDLPLFESHHNTLLSINPLKEHVCLKNKYPSVPTDGVNHWAETSDIIILKYDYYSEPLYKRLNINCIGPAELYCNFILPNFHCFKREHYIVHLEYVRGEVLQERETKEEILNLLKGIAFIQSSDGTLKKAGDFYDKKIKIFKIMLPNTKFLPAPFDNELWYDFLVQIGLQRTVTVELFVTFAYAVQEHADNVTEDVSKKSDVLVEHLCRRSDLRREGILPKIKYIRFVKPVRLNDYRTKIHAQFNSGHYGLITYSGSVLSSNINSVWTVANCISSVPPDDRHSKDGQSILQLLAVLPKVDSQLFSNHMRNVCLSLNERLMDKVGVGKLYCLFQGFYQFIKDTKETTSISLGSCPTIYLPETNQLVEPWRVLLEPNKTQLIDNRIFKASVQFGLYFDVWKTLGVKENAEASIYLRVLEELNKEWKSEELSPNEYIVVRKCVENLNVIWKDVSTRHSTIDSTNNTLYLPSEKGIMQSSKDLVLEDNKDFRNRVKVLDLEYFIGFDTLETDITDAIYDHSKWPKVYQMKPLSEIVIEVLNPGCKESYGEVSNDIKYRLKHPEMINALVRLIKHFQPDCNEDLLEGTLKKINDINVVEVDNLSLKLEYKNELVEGSENHVKVFGIATVIYVDKSFKQEDMIELVAVLAKILPSSRVFGSDNYLYLSKLLEMVKDDPNKISIWLDQKKIRQCDYNSKIEKIIIFPKPGTSIPDERHWILNNSFVRFYKGEYVGYEVFDPAVDDVTEDTDVTDKPIYIYAVIVEILQEGTATEFARYKIDIGEDQNIDVDSTKIYKFYNNLTCSSREIVLSEESQEGRISPDSDVPNDKKSILKEIRQLLTKAWKLPEADRKRVIKRLLLKWHPDKNPNIMKLATEITQKIFNYIEQLRAGRSLEEDDDDKDYTDGASSTRYYYSDDATSPRDYYFDGASSSRDYHFDGASSSRDYYPGDSYSSFYSNMYARGRSYARYSNDQRSSRSYYSDSSFHSHTGPIPRPDQAKRWFRQARFDIEAAEESQSQKCDNYNWICYMCQQSAEKALKAVWYTIDSNRVSLEHNLSSIASGLDQYPELVYLADQLQSCIGDHTRMRYPDTLHFPKVPKDVYNRNQSTEACTLTNEIILYVSNIVYELS